MFGRSENTLVAGRHMLGLKPGNALVQFADDFLAGHNLPGGKLCLALGKGLKPTGGGLGAVWDVVHREGTGGLAPAFQPTAGTRPESA